MPETVDLPIRDQMIRLGQLLKLASLVDDGSEARAVIEAGEVTVDGVVETRRGRQLVPGMTVSYAGRQVRVTGSVRLPPGEE